MGRGRGSSGGRGGGRGGQNAAPPDEAAVSTAQPAPATPGGVLAAFDASPGHRDNFVSLADLRERMGGTRAEQDAAILAAARAGRISLDSHEGLVSGMTPRLREAAIYLNPVRAGSSGVGIGAPDGRRYEQQLVWVAKR